MKDINEIFDSLEKNNYAAFFFTPPIYKNAKSYFFSKPERIIRINKSNYIKNFREIDDLFSDGSVGYSIINYETGFLFEQKLSSLINNVKDLALFVFFNNNNIEVVNSDKIKFNFNLNHRIKYFHLNTSKTDYLKSIQKIKYYIKEGDTYQVNYTVKGNFEFEGNLCSLFQNLIFNQSARYIAAISLPDKFIISISPELFFEIKNGKISTRPMKGTSSRGFNLQSDLIASYNLMKSDKEKAENVMIVDLLRNDLGRVSKFGKVTVNNLFEIERYESLFQMTSEINSTLKTNVKFSDIIKNIFPCGSVTGAPKIRTMEVIDEIEKDKRNIYTGSIGLFLKNKITMNVSIRTLVINKKNQRGEIGLGSGIVWDSNPEKEYNEVKLKSKFLTSPQSYFEIFETILINNSEPVFLKEHLLRMKSTAEYFLFHFDEKAILKKLFSLLKKLDNKKSFKLKITLRKYGDISFNISELPTFPDKIKIILSHSRINSQNKFQYFKTTNRKLYDEEYLKFSAKGFFEIIYLNENNEVTEGSITNIFLKRRGIIFTPPINCGILPGVYRNHLLRNSFDIKEKKIFINDLIEADEIFLTNSVRGQIKVDEFYLNQRE